MWRATSPSEEFLASADGLRIACARLGTSTWGYRRRVMVRIAEIVVDSHDPERAAAFWCAALGYHARHRGVARAALVPSPPLTIGDDRHGPTGATGG